MGHPCYPWKVWRRNADGYPGDPQTFGDAPAAIRAASATMPSLADGETLEIESPDGVDHRWNGRQWEIIGYADPDEAAIRYQADGRLALPV